jgi:hypothetical protein
MGLAWVEVTVNDKHCSLLQHQINCCCKMFYGTAPGVMFAIRAGAYPFRDSLGWK